MEFEQPYKNYWGRVLRWKVKAQPVRLQFHYTRLPLKGSSWGRLIFQCDLGAWFEIWLVLCLFFFISSRLYWGICSWVHLHATVDWKSSEQIWQMDVSELPIKSTNSYGTIVAPVMPLIRYLYLGCYQALESLAFVYLRLLPPAEIAFCWFNFCMNVGKNSILCNLGLVPFVAVLVRSSPVESACLFCCLKCLGGN